MSGASRERQAEVARVTAEVAQNFIVSDGTLVRWIVERTGCSRQTAWRHLMQLRSGIKPQNGGPGRGQGRKLGSKNKSKETK